MLRVTQYWNWLKEKLANESWMAEALLVIVGGLGYFASNYYDDQVINYESRLIIHKIGTDFFWRCWVISSLIAQGIGLSANLRWLRALGACGVFWAMVTFAGALWQGEPWVPSFWLHIYVACIEAWAIVRQVSLVRIQWRNG